MLVFMIKYNHNSLSFEHWTEMPRNLGEVDFKVWELPAVQLMGEQLGNTVNKGWKSGDEILSYLLRDKTHLTQTLQHSW